jgi:tRNA dimethylallyltransferase
MVDEVRRLLASGIRPEDLIYYGLEYKYLTLYATGQLSYETMVEELQTAIFQFAKRQMTWFRGMERRGIPIRWVDYAQPLEERAAQVVEWYREASK